MDTSLSGLIYPFAVKVLLDVIDTEKGDVKYAYAMKYAAKLFGSTTGKAQRPD